MLNCFLNLLNRWALGLYGLRFPLVMTASHMIFGACALAPMMTVNANYAAKHSLVLRHGWKGITAIAVMNGFQIACNNASLTVMELSMNQVAAAPPPRARTSASGGHRKRAVTLGVRSRPSRGR